MGRFFGIFSAKSEKKEETSSISIIANNITLSFSRLREDISKIGLWIRYFAEEGIKNRQDHSLLNAQMEAQRNEISELKKNQELFVSALEKNADAIGKIGLKIEKINEIDELKEKITVLNARKEAEDNLGTCPGTSTGQVRDKTNPEKNRNIRFENTKRIRIAAGNEEKIAAENNPEEERETIAIDRSKFLASELEVIKAMYYADRPMGYSEIAKLLGKSEKSIRNLICDIRKKNIEVLDRPIGIREKGFYLSGKAKILISGR